MPDFWGQSCSLRRALAVWSHAVKEAVEGTLPAWG